MPHERTHAPLRDVDRLQDEIRDLRAALAASEARFASIIERTADALVIVGADQRVRFVNAAAERLLGRSADELIDTEFGVAVTAGDSAEIDLVAQAGRDAIVAELRAGATTWNGEQAQVISLRDITDRKRAHERDQRLLLERAAREQAEQATRRARFLAEAGALLDASLEPAAILSAVAHLLVPRMGDWCVIEVVEGEGGHRSVALHADPERQAVAAELARQRGSLGAALRGEGRGPIEPLLHRDLVPERVQEIVRDESLTDLLVRLGVRSVLVVPMRTHGWAGEMTVGCGERNYSDDDAVLATEVAGHTARVLETARLYRAALGANRAKADFLAVMSHELRTPLNAIIGYADLMLGGLSGPLGDTQAEQIERIQASANHLLRVIEEILTYARTEGARETLHPGFIAVGELVDGIVAVAEPIVRERHLEFRLSADDGAAVLYTDGDKLRQIALNLLTNAAKFTERGHVELRVELDGDDLVLTVEDTGIGIPRDNLERIFEPFWQAEQPLTRHAGGTGLGLAVVRRLSYILGGSISVTSEPGNGSAFVVRVPAHVPMNGA